MRWQGELSDDPATDQGLRCPLCGGKAPALCVPNPSQSVLSDGRVVPRSLRKVSCLTCGAASHAQALSAEQIQAIYDNGYSLSGKAPKSDAARARAYAQWIRSVCLPPRSVLEVGCGSGALLRELSAIWPQAICYGVDPALPGVEQSDPRIRLERGFIEDIPNDLANFGLIVAVNVIEHAPNPGAFLASLRSRLAPDGKIVIVCPAAEPPNSELLFFDHLFSLTPDALGLAVAGTPLVPREHLVAPASIGDFQMITFDAADRSSNLPLRRDSFRPLWSEREAYLGRWERLDQALADRTRSARRLVAFGGGQAAALLRAYAPRTWARVELMVLDEVDEAWSLGIPAAPYKDGAQTLETAGILIATSPRVQGLIADRLQSDGLRSIRWDDLITN